MRWSDMDAYQHINNVAFLGYFEMARVNLFFEHPTHDEKTGLRRGLVVASHEIAYKRSVLLRRRGGRTVGAGGAAGGDCWAAWSSRNGVPGVGMKVMTAASRHPASATTAEGPGSDGLRSRMRVRRWARR